MDYSDRVNSKKGAGGVADAQEADVHRKKRVKELLTSSILNLDSDPYVFRNHLGLLECKLCLTTHNNESSYLSHVGGKKHQLNLEKRRVLDDKANRVEGLVKNGLSINSVPKRRWNKIGTPEYKVTKIRDPETFQMGLLIHAKYPQGVDEPLFRIQTYFELSAKNQNVVVSYHDRYHRDNGDVKDIKQEARDLQYVVILCEPYENICVVVPGGSIDVSEGQSRGFWWYWDRDVGDFYLQFLYKSG